jgi:hypothetical protein
MADELKDKVTPLGDPESVAGVGNNGSGEEKPASPGAPTSTEPSEKAKVEGLIDAVEQINTSPRPQRIVGPMGTPYEAFDRTYTQRPLSMLGGMSFIRIVGKAIDSALAGDDAPTFAEIAGASTLDVSGLTNIDGFMRMLARLSMYAENLFKDIYMLALSVPVGERGIVSDILDMPCEDQDGVKRGGLDYDDGTEILKVFVAQNSKELVKLFRDQAPSLVRQIQDAVSTPEQSTP